MARDGQHVVRPEWPWTVIAGQLSPGLGDLPSYDDRHIVQTGSLDSFLSERHDLDSPLTHLNSLGLDEEEMDSETGHMTAAPKDQAWVPTT